MYIQIETFMCAITSHKKQRAKYQTEILLRSAKLNSNSSQEVKLQEKFPAKKVPSNYINDNQTFSCDYADGHSQTGNRKNISK